MRLALLPRLPFLPPPTRRHLSTTTTPSSFLVGPSLQRALAQTFSIKQPSQIQQQALPLALAGKDVICCAQTGSGKTLVFLLPLLQRISELHTRRSAASPRPTTTPKKGSKVVSRPEALVLVPTAALARQVSQVASELARHLWSLPRVLSITGGAKYDQQRQALRDGDVRLLVATPERLLYHIGQGNVSLRSVRWLAIDEADAMLSAADGITRETDHVLAKLHDRGGEMKQKPPQVILTAATMREEHEEHARGWFPQLERVSHVGVLVPTLRKRFVVVRGFKEEELLRTLESAAADPWLAKGATIIFCGGARRAERVLEVLQGAMPWLKPSILHGETEPQAREAVLTGFKEDDTRLLVSTDVVARGLDFVHVRHVINYDPPRDVQTFIHRAGRTARKGQEGLVTCLMWPSERRFYNQFRSGDTAATLETQGGRRGRDERTTAEEAEAERDWEEEARAAPIEVQDR